MRLLSFRIPPSSSSSSWACGCGDALARSACQESSSVTTSQSCPAKCPARRTVGRRRAQSARAASGGRLPAGRADGPSSTHEPGWLSPMQTLYYLFQVLLLQSSHILSVQKVVLFGLRLYEILQFKEDGKHMKPKPTCKTIVRIIYFRFVAPHQSTHASRALAIYRKLRLMQHRYRQ